MHEPPLTFGAWAARLRKGLDLTQQELADRVGCSVSALRKIESDERRPSREIAALLAEALEIPADQRAAFLKLARREWSMERMAMADARLALYPPSDAAPAPAASPPGPELPPAPPAPLSFVPAPSTPLVGREHERNTITALLREPNCRLVSLVGPGGIGKSRLALQAAADHLPHPDAPQRTPATDPDCLPDGVFFVGLASLTAPEQIASTIAALVGCTLHGPGDATEQLLHHLRERSLLLVLDNMEHLLDGVGLLADILREAPGVHMLATSRERLNLQGEWVFEVQGLPIPPAADHSESTAAPLPAPLPDASIAASSFEASSAVQLFLQSAQRARVGFTPSAEDRTAIVRICRLVEGLPLAIELAAGWVRLLSCTEIADEIESDLRFLASSARDVPQRHRSISAVFDQSWALLDEREQRVLRRLSLFRGGFDREQAEPVAGASLALLSTLVARSLVRRSGPHRYDLHELVRQYCAERLAESGEADAARAAHARAQRDLAVQARLPLLGHDQREWLDRVEADHHNIRAALDWCLTSGHIALGLETAAALSGFWYQRDYQDEGLRRLLALLADTPPHTPVTLEVDAHNAAGYLAYELGEFDVAQQQLERAHALLGDAPNPNLLANTLVVLGQVYGSLGDYAAARRVLEQALALAQDDLYAQRRRASALMALADVTSLTGDDEHAQFLYAAGAAIYRDRGDANAIAYALRKWAWSALRCGDADNADALTRESLAINQRTGSKIGTIACLATLAAVLAQRDATEDAARLLAAAESLSRRASMPLRPMDRLGVAYTRARLHERLDADALAALTQAAQGWTLDQALAAASRP